MLNDISPSFHFLRGGVANGSHCLRSILVRFIAPYARRPICIDESRTDMEIYEDEDDEIWREREQDRGKRQRRGKNRGEEAV